MLDGCAWSMGSLLYDIASLLLKEDADVQRHRSLLARQVADGHLRSTAQVVAAIHFIRALPTGTATESVHVDQLHKACGVGVTVDENECQATIASLLDAIDDIDSIRYKALPVLLKAVRDHDRLKWADGKMTKSCVDSLLLQRLGPKDERDMPAKKVNQDYSVDRLNFCVEKRNGKDHGKAALSTEFCFVA